MLAVVGRNGAGKSTFLRLLNGLLRPRTGHVSVGGQPLGGLKVHEISRHVGTLFQTPQQQLFAQTVFDEVAFGPRQRKLDRDAIARRAGDAIERCNLAAVAAIHPLDLDCASRRFVALATVLALDPPVLLLDEPLRGLDRAWTERLEGIIAEARAEGKAVILICHDMDFVDRNADSILPLGVPDPAKAGVAEFFADGARVAAASVHRPDRLLVRTIEAGLARSPPGAGFSV